MLETQQPSDFQSSVLNQDCWLITKDTNREPVNIQFSKYMELP